MSKPHTLIELLRGNGLHHGETIAYSFVGDGERSNNVSYGELDGRARAIGARLQKLGAAGETVMLFFSPGLDFVAAFFGCLYAGAIAVPTYPPKHRRTLDRLEAIVADAGATFALTTSTILSRSGSSRDLPPAMRSMRWLATEHIGDELATEWVAPQVDQLDLAYLQYTSGSTAIPKGVMVSHLNVLDNVESISDGFEHTPSSVSLTWLPHFHDMGLVDGIILPLFVGCHAYLMPPAAFLQRPVSWLEAITRYEVTHSGGPNFAYDLCVRKIGMDQRAGLNLATWSVAYSGSEPVRFETINRFANAFEPHGFKRNAFYPAYGLAEATLKVTGGRKSRGPIHCTVQATALRQGHIELVATDDANVQVLVSSGHPEQDTRIVIADPELLAECPGNKVGEIWVSGPSVASGYWGRPAESEATFRAHLSDTGEGPFLRTGDLGFMQDGELFITGRLKDLIIIRGLNHYPQDIECTMAESWVSLRAGSGVAFSIDVEGEERLVLVQEIERHQASELDDLLDAVRRAVSEGHEIQPYAVALVKPGEIQKTSSGKIQRQACRAKFREGSFHVFAQWFETNFSASADSAVVPVTALGSAGEIERWLLSRVANKIGLKASRIDRNQPIAHCGLDSLAAVELAQAVETSLGVTIPITSFLQDVSIAKLAVQIAGDQASAIPHAGVLGELTAETEDECPLSYGQRALWFLHRLAPESAAYNIAAPIRIRTNLDVQALRRTFQKLVQRHSSLRTTFFAAQDGTPFQRIHQRLEANLRTIDATALSETGLRESLAMEAYRPYNLEVGPPVRAILYRRTEQDYILLIAMHHIVADFQSLAILVREMCVLYGIETGATTKELAPLTLRYTDFVHWQFQRLSNQEGEKLRSFWEDSLAGELPLLNLPTDHPRPPVQTFSGDSYVFNLSAELTQSLKDLSCAHGATLYMTLLAAFQVLLHRYTRQEDILIGSPSSGRSHSSLMGLVGYFVNPIVLRANLSGNPIFTDFLNQVRGRTLAAFEHRDYPFALLVEWLKPERDPGRAPIFQVMLNFLQDAESGLASFTLNHDGPRAELEGLSLEAVSLEEQTAQFDLTLTVIAGDRGLEAALQYNTDLFGSHSIERLAGHFEQLLKGIVANPRATISELPLLTENERVQLLLEWNNTSAARPDDSYLHNLFECQSEKTPNAVALRFGEQTVTYRELNARANRLGHYLQRIGVGPEVRVGICMQRSVELIVGMLGILKAGGAYLPLDPLYPRDRLAFMLDDAQAYLLLTQQHLRSGLPAMPGTRVLQLDTNDARVEMSVEREDNPATSVAEQNLAYIIYTSGSTGRPKGVAITHANAAAFLRWAGKTFTKQQLQGVLATTSISFDLSVFEIFAPLSWGGQVILTESILHLPELTLTHEVTLINTVPSAMMELIRAKSLPPGVQTVNLAGEALSQQLVQHLYETENIRQVFNLYGPSEDTTYSTYALVENNGHAPTIGRPIANTEIYILDGAMQPVPVGVSGEIYIGGEGLARGYLNRPELTAERFLPHGYTSEAGRRLYRTGDLGRYRANGEIEFQGRVDQQVKVRGYRIELGEIEAALREQEAVSEAVVMARGEGSERHLVAYVVAAGVAVRIEELREQVRQKLPTYMAPSTIVLLDELPLLPNGKVDRGSLPEPDAERGRSAASYAAPRTAAEEVVAEVWAEVLGVERVGIHDNFFELGGQSLLAARVVSRVDEVFNIDLPLRGIFESPTVVDLANRVAAAMCDGRSARSEPLTPVPRDSDSPLSFAQQRLWFLEQLEPGRALYNMTATAHLKGPLNVTALEHSFNEVAQRHEILRTTFVHQNDRPHQLIAASLNLRLEVSNLEEISESTRRETLQRLVREEARRSFTLSGEPLLRTRLLRLGADEHVLLVSMHHIVGDGWSVGILLRELGALYETFALGTTPKLPDLPVQYIDFAHWEQRRLERGELESELKYWRQQLTNMPSLLTLPTDRPRTAAQTYSGEKLSFVLPAELTKELKGLSRRESSTLFMTLLAAFHALLHRYTGEQDISVGTPVAVRNHAKVEGLIGLFINTLVLRVDLGGNPTFRELLKREREVCLAGYAHQELPFEKLVDELGIERNLIHSPLFQVMFALNNTPREVLKLSGLEVDFEEVDNGTTKFDLIVSLEEIGGELRGVVKYKTDLFDMTTIERLVGHYEQVLTGVALDPDRRISDLPLLTAGEEQELLVGWNDTASEFPRASCLHQLFEAQVELNPQAVAVIFEHERMSYAELNARADLLAQHLLSIGLCAENCVGVCMERSVELLVAVLGVLKAGGVYVPLDPSYPPERLALMAEDADIKVLLTQARLVPNVPAHTAHLLCLDHKGDFSHARGNESFLPRGVSLGISSAQLAYIIYTSGSTGTPKGVGISHRAIVNHLTWRQQTYPLTSADRFLYKASISFDISVWELFAPLLAGAQLVMAAPGGHQDSSYLVRLVAQRQVSIAHFGPSMLKLVLNEPGLEHCQSLRHVFCGGEPLTGKLRNLFVEKLMVQLHHQYGPTEATVDATVFDCKRENDGHEQRLPIGKPIANTQVYIVDANWRPVPVGVSGELLIGGEGLARGYLNQPSLTAEKFIPDPFGTEPGARLYRTGDLARYRSDGQIEFLSRLDHQVKVRGYRVEPGEVETILRGHAELEDAIVIAQEHSAGDTRLVGYVVARGSSAPSMSGLRNFLESKLPPYMVPSIFVLLDELPLLPNGKIDRQALPELKGSKVETDYELPSTAIEEMVAGIWAEVLGVEQIGSKDNFFEIGGHSLLSIQVIARVREALGVTLPVRSMFEAPTVSAQAGQVERSLRARNEVESTSRVGRVKRDREMSLSHAQERMWLLWRLTPQSAAYNISGALRLQGALDLGVLERALNEIARRHETLHTTFIEKQGQLAQIIAPDSDLRVGLEDLQFLDEETRQVEAERLSKEEAARPFDLGCGPLWRARLLRLAETEWILMVTMHHIVSDGWSVGLLLDELSKLYAAFSAGEPSTLAELPIQYVDYAAWQREWLNEGALERQLSYWRDQLAGAKTLLALPSARPRPSVESYRGTSAVFSLPVSLSDSVKKLSQREGVTLFMLLTAGFNALLQRYTGACDICVGTPAAGRNRTEIEGLIGLFVNTLVLRVDLSGDPTFRELLRRVRETCLGAYAHQDVPFEKLVEELGVERSLSHAPLFQVMFALSNMPHKKIELPGLKTKVWAVDSGTAKFDLTLAMENTANGLTATLEYNTDLFDFGTVQGFFDSFHMLLEDIVAFPDKRLSEICLLTKAQQRKLLVEWNATPREYRSDICIHQLFEEQVARTPEATALAAAGMRLSYAELNEMADAVARRLRVVGVRAEQRVGLMMGRSVWLVGALLGVLKAGGTYVPLDPKYPQQRLEWMMADADVSVLLTEPPLRHLLPDGPWQVLYVDDSTAPQPVTRSGGDDFGSSVCSDNLAYVIYTSGSTGIPKGVAITHRSAVALIEWSRSNYSPEQLSGVLASTSISFDLSVFELFVPLCCGGKVLLAENALEIISLETRSEVTLINTVPSAMMELIRAKSLPPGVQTVNLAGEALSQQLVQHLYEKENIRQVFNLYGPSEDTTYSTYALVENNGHAPTIGRPIANTEIYILDGAMQPVPVEVSGEIYIGGEGLARGYLNMPGLTAERFLPHGYTSEAGRRLYRTGDLGRYRANGEIEFQGRVDQQVKVRGYRIELGEIEAALREQEAVSEAVVIARGEGSERHLVAYVVAAGVEVRIEELREQVRQKLPAYMAPSTIVLLDELPLLPNGKVDRGSLPEPDAERGRSAASYAAPRTAVEEVVAEVWADVLGVKRVGIHDNFFELGGQSLLALKVGSILREIFQVELPLRSLFESQTVAKLSIDLTMYQSSPGQVEKIAALLERINSMSAEEIGAML